MFNNYEIKPFTPNVMQMRNALLKPRGHTLIAGRGTGKSTDIAWIMKNIIEEMPRSVWPIVGRTFTDILKNTLPGTIEALENLGYIRNRDYFIGRKAPEKWDWPEPYRPPLSPDNVIWTKTGTVFPFLSQDREGSNRGPSYNGIICDEGLNLIRDRFEKEILIANRGDLKRYNNVAMHHGVFIYSSMPYLEGQWLLEHAKYYAEFGIDYDRIWREIHKLEIELIDTDDAAFRQATWVKIKKLRSKIRYFKDKLGFLYSEANIFDNIKNIGFKKILEYRKLMADLTFRLEVLNEKLTILVNSFYPCLNEDKHLYSAFDYSHIDSLLGDNFNLQKILESEDARQDVNVETNYDPDKPLEIAWDIGAAINYLVISQDFYDEIRIIHSMYVKQPYILDHLFEKFMEYYRFHKNKTIFFWYDPSTGNSHKDNSVYTSAEQAMRLLAAKGWNVIPQTTWGSNTYHHEKYDIINKVLLEDDNRFPRIRINKQNNKDLIISIKNTGVKQGFKGFRKDKDSERSASIPREHATDGSDAFDLLIYGKLRSLWDNITDLSPITTS